MDSVIPYILFAGVVQGTILFLASVHFNRGKKDGFFLALFFAAYTLDILYAFYVITGLSLSWPVFLGLSAPLPFIYAPSLYLFARSKTVPLLHTSKTALIHYLPSAVLTMLLLLSYAIVTGDQRIAFTGPDTEREWYFFLIRAAIPLYGIGYLMLSYKAVNDFHRRLLDNYSAIENRNLRWLVYLTIGITLIWILELVQSVLIDLLHFPEGIAYPYIYAAASLFFTALIYHALIHPGFFSVASIASPAADAETVQRQDKPSLKPLLTEAETGKALADLDVIMKTSCPYKDPDLSVSDLAALIHLSPQKLSRLLNHTMGTTFYDYINSFRVYEVIRMMENDSGSVYTLLSMAFDAGFSSKSTFNSVFKKVTGLTPTDYRRKHFSS